VFVWHPSVACLGVTTQGEPPDYSGCPPAHSPVHPGYFGWNAHRAGGANVDQGQVLAGEILRPHGGGDGKNDFVLTSFLVPLSEQSI
jgi:hypothetical protein